jgi:fructokinase
LKINDEEVETVANLLGWNGKSELDICRQLLEMYGLKMVVLTRGSEDSYVLSSTEVSHKLTPHVPVVDTVGAGDSFTAAFVAGILSGKSISEAHQLAVDVSAYVCTQPGAMPVLPEDLRNRLQ